METIFWNLKKIYEFDDKLEVNLFYAVRIYSKGIELQGKANTKTIEKIKSLGIKLIFDNEHNWLTGDFENINITLFI